MSNGINPFTYHHIHWQWYTYYISVFMVYPYMEGELSIPVILCEFYIIIILFIDYKLAKGSEL